MEPQDQREPNEVELVIHNLTSELANSRQEVAVLRAKLQVAERALEKAQAFVEEHSSDKSLDKEE